MIVFDPVRSERIEHFLVWIGATYLKAERIENNHLSDAELLEALVMSSERVDRPVPGRCSSL
jgi:hypothetical protein